MSVFKNETTTYIGTKPVKAFSMKKIRIIYITRISFWETTAEILTCKCFSIFKYSHILTSTF